MLRIIIVGLRTFTIHENEWSVKSCGIHCPLLYFNDCSVNSSCFEHNSLSKTEILIETLLALLWRASIVTHLGYFRTDVAL